jgi:NitT/TauT family transport system ATP-binding protein
LEPLARGFGEDETREQLATAIGWGRYGELFDFHVDTGELVLSRADAG